MSEHRHGYYVVGPDEDPPNLDVLCPPEGRGPSKHDDVCGWVRFDAHEWALHQAYINGGSVRFRVPKSLGSRAEMTGWMTGTVTHTMLYDGLSAKVVEDDPDHRIVWTVIPSCGAEVLPVASHDEGGGSWP